MAVLFFHISKDIYGEDWRPAEWGWGGGVLRYGAWGVEFFFITSGYFMANSVSKLQSDPQSLVKETWTYAWKKLKPILPYHVIFNLTAFFIGIVRGHTFEEHINRLSCLFFLPAVGFNDLQWMLGAEWYVGCMLFGMLIIYPFLRRWTDQFIGYFAPVLTIILYGYMSYNCEAVMGSNRLIQTFGTLMLGITVFSLSQYIGCLFDRINSGWLRRILRIYPLLVITFFLAYMNTSIDTNVQAFLVLLLASGLVFSFGKQGLLSRSGVFDKKVVYWLGKMSLPIYMVQNITRTFVQVLFKNQTAVTMYILESAMTIVCGILGYYLLDALRVLKRKAKHDIVQ